jgi:hypothetical protein
MLIRIKYLDRIVNFINLSNEYSTKIRNKLKIIKHRYKPEFFTFKYSKYKI